jgi:hypothetical protein
MSIFSSVKVDVSESDLRNVSAMLLVYGLARTLDYFCTISVFSLD